ncbi:hypothetical protein SADUNF_Sadunf06G0123800 [Salix dunnii]|uniref:Uncharacterized protein n=1 Tax=Salix dunnii TaxID=1413687 RepID=A0A835MXE7_9ROSI|nr:hypothetical protein SADUNF_Sadunf06G0123800 [Salix dunnii]
MHSLSGLEASQMPEAIIGIEQRKAMKFRKAVMLLATPIAIAGFRTVLVICGKGKEKVVLRLWCCVDPPYLWRCTQLCLKLESDSKFKVSIKQNV